MLIVTTEKIDGINFKTLGFVSGSTIQVVNMFKDLGSSFKTLVGGELINYNKMMQEARNIAIERMVTEAKELGADAIVSVRISSSSIMQGAAEVVAYGTAVKFV